MPQFEGGRAVKVKNTFIDVEESPKETDKRRSRSMPPPIFTEGEEEEESETLDQVSSPVSLHGTHYSEARHPLKQVSFMRAGRVHRNSHQHKITKVM